MAYIGNFPTSPGFQTVNFKQNDTTQVTRAQSGRAIRNQIATTIWSATLRFPSMSIDEWRPIQAFIAQARGPLNEFDVILPTISESQSINKQLFDGTITVNDNTAAGATTVNVGSSTGTDAVNLLKAGDLVRFTNHTKVYMITADINTDDSAGNFDLLITPPLIEAVTASEAVETTDVRIRMAISNDTQEFGYRTDGLVDYEVDVEEVI